MKQLPMTPALSALIQERVGPDVETANLAVFETIALNTLPLPGKDGTIFERAVSMPLTLSQMVESINSGKHIPLIADHEMWGAPKGRAFHSGLNVAQTGEMEIRMLFYLDPSEGPLIAKLNAGSLDEVSVAFLSKQFNCSECGWDYFQFGSGENIYERTCGNGHKIGENGVHAEMSGLSQFIELSLVARGAADKPKIVGKSEARLAPEQALSLAAKGFEPNALVVQASRGKEVTMDLTAALTQISTLSTDKGTLTANLATATSERDASRTEVTRLTGVVSERDASIATLTSERDAALLRPDASVKTDLDAALAYLAAQYDHLTVASGKPKVEGDARPKTVAAFTAAIDEMTNKLTSILPVGGRGKTTEELTTKQGVNRNAFALRK
ncbi:MAG: hypothetical protein ABW128_22745 [Rhizorhabdus sp.]